MVSIVSKDNIKENQIESPITAPQAIEKRLEKKISLFQLFYLFSLLFHLVQN